MQSLREHSVAGLAKREREGGTADHASVNKGHLQGSVAATLARTGDPPPDGNPRFLHRRHGNQLGEEFLTMEITKPHCQILRGGQTEDLALVTDAGEGDLRMGRGQDLQLLEKIRRLGLLTAQEFAARRDIEEQIGHLDARAGCLSGIAHVCHLAADDLDQCARCLLPATGRQFEPRDARDARHCFSPEAKGHDRGQVGAFANLARGMPFKAEEGVGAVHAAPVVGDADETGASALKLDGDALGSRVDGVLDQFLDHRGGALDHLTGSHLAGQNVGKEADGAHPKRMKDEG